MEPKKPAKKAAKKTTKKVVPPPVPPQPLMDIPELQPPPAWHMKRVLSDYQLQLDGYMADGWMPFAVDNGWVYLRRETP